MSLSRKILPTTISEAQMAGGEVRTLVLTVAIITLLAVGVYLVDPTMFGLVRKEGFADVATLSKDSTASKAGTATAAHDMDGKKQVAQMEGNPAVVNAAASPSTAGFANEKEGFANLDDITGPAEFGATPSPSGCYPRDQLTPGELLPKDANSTWAQQNPMGTGSLKGKNFLSAGALVGVNTVGQSLRNANQQLRSEPPNPQVPVSVFFNSTIEPDTNRRDMEIN